jgi:hypothetical protein
MSLYSSQRSPKNPTTLTTPNKIVNPGIFSFAKCSNEILEQKSVSTFKLTRDPQKKLTKPVIKNKVKDLTTLSPVDVKTIPKRQTKSKTTSETLESGSVHSVASESVQSESSRKSAYELESILIERQIKLKKLTNELEKA